MFPPHHHLLPHRKRHWRTRCGTQRPATAPCWPATRTRSTCWSRSCRRCAPASSSRDASTPCCWTSRAAWRPRLPPTGGSWRRRSHGSGWRGHCCCSDQQPRDGICFGMVRGMREMTELTFWERKKKCCSHWRKNVCHVFYFSWTVPFVLHRQWINPSLASKNVMNFIALSYNSSLWLW